MDGLDPLGRNREVSALREIQEEVEAGIKHAVLLLGEAGVGKSTLLDWSARWAHSSGFVSAITRVPSVGGVPPLFPLPEILRELSRGTDVQTRSTDREDSWGSDLLSAANDVLSVVTLLERLSESSPLAVFVDDLQWAPQEGLSLLYSALRIAKARVLLVMTCRTGMKPGPLPTTSSDLKVEFLNISGLDQESVGELARQTLRGSVLPSLTHALYDRTLGNPLLVNEMLRSWKTSAAITSLSGGYWTVSELDRIQDSRSLVEMISVRLKMLDEKPFECATALALLGRGGRPDELRLLLGVSANKIVELLATLEDSGIADRDSWGGRYKLAHPLFQSALIQSLGETKRADLHGRIFRLMSQSETSSPAETAYHGVRALERPSNLAVCLRLAALEAERMGAYAQAALWYGHLAEAAGDIRTLRIALAGRAAAAEHFDPKMAVDIYGEAITKCAGGQQHARLLLGRARAWRMAGRPDKALEDLERAAASANRADLLEMRDATAVIHAVIGHGELARTQFEELVKESKGTQMHARVLGHLATSEYFQGHIHAAVQLFKEALSAGQDIQTIQYLNMNLGWLETLLGEWGQAAPLLEAEIEDARSANDLWRLVPLMTSATALYVWQGELDKALDLGDQAMRMTDETYLMDRLGAMGALGLVLLEKGLISEAAQLLAPAPAMVGSSSEKNEVQLSLIVFGDCLLHLGDITRCKEIIKQLRQTLIFNLSWKPSTDRLESACLLADGQPERALAVLESLLSDPSDIAVHQAEVYLAAARALSYMGRSEEALRAATLALEIYESLNAHNRVRIAKKWLEANVARSRGRPKARLVSNLTARELQILRLVVKGAPNTEIAGDLFISVATVKKHIENIRLKLGAARRSQLIAVGLDIIHAAEGVESSLLSELRH
jgi:DNA-binding CsgD family transcriptional regulator